MDYIKLDAFLRKEGLKRATYSKDSIENACISFFEEVLEEYKKDIIPKDINFCIYWIDRNDEVNANVILIDDTYFIGLFSGVIRALQDHFGTFYGKPQEIFKKLLLPLRDHYFNFNSDEGDISKRKMCNHLMSYAMAYLVMHEVGHIFCGHCEKEEVFFYENNSELNQIMGYKSQAKEMCADFYGIANSYNLFLCTYIEYPKSVEPFSVLYLLAAYSIFWIFNFYKIELKNCDCSKMSHPHPQVRYLYFQDFLLDELQHSIEMFKKHGKIYAQNVDAQRTFEDVLDDFVKVISKTDLSFMYDKETFLRCNEEVIKIKAELKSVLERYKEKAYVLLHLDFNKGMNKIM